jgi:adenylate cyclase
MKYGARSTAVARKVPLSFLITAVVLVLAVLLRAWDPVPVARLRLAIFDNFIANTPRAAHPEFPVKIVDIDEASLAKLGQWPWPRSTMAAIIDRLREAGVATISVDLILAEPDRLSPAALAERLKGNAELAPLLEKAAALPANDKIFADAIGKAPVILGLSGEAGAIRNMPAPRATYATAGDDPKLFVPSFSGGTGSLPEFAAAAAGLGAVNWIPERDQVVRRVPLLLNINGQLYPSLSLETLRVAYGKDTSIFVKSSGASGVESFGEQTGIESIRTGDTILPADWRGELWLKYAAADPKRYISAAKLLDGAVPASEIEGRHIFIGSSATGLLDLRATPLAPSVPGVEIHAQAFEQMLSGDHLVRPAWATGAEIAFLVLTGALVAWLIRKSGAIMAAVASLAAIGAVWMFSSASFSSSGLLFDPLYPSLAIITLYLAGSLTNYVKAEADRARIRSAFGYYVAPAVVEELALSQDKLKLGGESRDVTLLFADVRGFSKLSEGMDAEELIRFVNTLFTPLTENILAHRGTIDKFMGDAVMAFWNAPLPDAAHHANACNAALDMMRSLAELNQQRAEANLAPIRIGIGINTGACVVGNVGSPQRFDYSVLGDPVNTAARLEEMTKTFGAPVILGERTAEAVKDFALVEIGVAALRGKDRGERLFALLGNRDVAGTAAFQAFRRAFDDLTNAAAAKDRNAMTLKLKDLRAFEMPHTAELLAAFERRMGE